MITQNTKFLLFQSHFDLILTGKNFAPFFVYLVVCSSFYHINFSMMNSVIPLYASTNEIDIIFLKNSPILLIILNM